MIGYVIFGQNFVRVNFVKNSKTFILSKNVQIYFMILIKIILSLDTKAYVPSVMIN